MFKDFGNFGQIIKLQKQMKDIQKNLRKKEATGQSPDGSVKAIVNGEFQLQDIIIDESLFQTNNREKLKKSIISAVNAAIENSKGAAAQEMSGLTSQLNIPGLGELFK